MEMFYAWSRHSQHTEDAPRCISRGNNLIGLQGLFEDFRLRFFFRIDAVQMVTCFCILWRYRWCSGVRYRGWTTYKPDPRTRILVQCCFRIWGCFRHSGNSGHAYESTRLPTQSYFEISRLISSEPSNPSVNPKGLLARNPDGEEVLAPFDGHLVLPTPRRGEKKIISDEASFISLPMKVRKVV